MSKEVSSAPSVPEPAPVPRGLVVPKALITYLDKKGPDYKHLVQLIKERDAFGQKKYGQRLMSEDGRDGIEDARQELGDLLQYVYKSMLGREKRSDLYEFFQTHVKPAYKILKELSKE